MIVPLLKGSLKKIPGLVPGIFFLCTASGWAAGLDLALELFEEKAWASCRRECRRVLIAEPRHELASLMLAVSSLREDVAAESSLEALAGLSERAADPEVRAVAGHEAARWLWRQDRAVDAWPFLKETFASTRSPHLYLQSGYALHRLLERHPELGKGEEALLTQLATSRPLWNWNVRTAMKAEFETPPERGGLGALFIAFYRGQIRPAIGNRCSLHPSCSEYFLEANHQHGWLSVPMVADRLMREPGVVSRAEKPIDRGGVILYEDPLSDHDFWHRESP